jgi:hypothetical protein
METNRMDANAKLYSLTKLSAVVAAATTVLWIIGIIIEAQSQTNITSPATVLSYLENTGPIFYFTYANAVLITLSATWFMSCLYLLCKISEPHWSLLGMLFVPVYCVMNLFAYGSQISILPQLLSQLHSAEQQPELVLFIAQLTQAWPISLVALMNVAAYAVLGIPSIIFGIILYLQKKTLFWPALLLALNGIACFVGILGAAANIPWLAFGCLLGGILYLFSLFGFILVFYKKERTNKYSSLQPL